MPEYFVTAELVLDTALHIGVGKGGDPTDAAVRRAGNGRLLIPGSSIAGSLRATTTRIAPRLGFKPCQPLLAKNRQDEKMPCGCPVCQLFGDVNPVEKPADFKGVWQDATASRLWIQDAFAAADSATFVRDGVGIDRVSGHAAKNVKFDYEVVPHGTAFQLNMRLDYKQDAVDAATEKNMQLLLTAVLLEWQEGRGQLGGNIARGLGRFHLKDLSFSEPQLASATELVTYLKASNRAATSKPMTDWPESLLAAARQKLVSQEGNDSSQSVAASFLSVTFDLQFSDLSLQHDPLVAMISGFDHAPLIEKITDDGLGNPVLAGSSIRGVLRSQAGKIIRTLYTAYCLDKESDSAEVFKENCPACNVLQSDQNEAIASCNSRLDVQGEADKHHEWQEDDFCLTCQLFGNQERGSRLWIRDAVWQKPGEATWQAQDFLAIDRFTGGGLDKAKFDAAPLTMARFKTAVTLHDPSAWELGLLALLLRDLAEGRITIGFGAAKGYGRVRATDFYWEVGYLTPEDANLFPDLKAVDSGIYKLSVNKTEEWFPADWLETANGWVNQFNKTVEGFKKREYVTGLKTDTFFDNEAADLYGRSRVEVN